jgi:lysozyme
MSFTTAQINALSAEGVSQDVIRRATLRLSPVVKSAAPVAGRRIGPRAAALLHHFEGCKLTAYKCPAGIWTIGWGNTFYEDGVPVAPGDKITQARANELFQLVLAKFEAAVEKAAPGAPAHQFGALVSFAYNVGIGAMEGSTLLRLHKAGNFAGAAEQFLRWDKAGVKVLKGLQRRRAAERLLYLNELAGFDAAIGYKP